ncbi:hypothetical protein E6W26_29020 [Pseudomonas aeruginosa]|uniref:hypothetical protein n=1 Tax=Pseudomonas aeruginosa TaxID=287 RepID=UPI00109E1FB3|nr:hypothetical protein [Pseudomonas aeruginosa]EKV1241284.1 hypothetical protein [Pseudomonas aeruginosa]EKV8586193.1 hypothetical protein [Pseudomonas aeruginosa]ELN5407411.1 hypothetical protein [Pseudomonas aeruginosa]ELP1438602.1 hypothetical protein [Pseudomonas aeruginosa]THB16441.1 hypothetical protein E6W26_29020 [Pseudomonas aeruginosa]
MNALPKQEKKRIKLTINPEYLKQLKLLQAFYGYSSTNKLIVDILCGVKLSSKTITKDSASINHSLSSNINQAIINFGMIKSVAETESFDSVTKEMKKIREGFKVKTFDQCLDAFIFQTGRYSHYIEQYKNNGVIRGLDENEHLRSIKEALMETDIHANTQGLGQNLAIDVDIKIFQKYFRPRVYKDPYNRRAFKHAIESNLEFYTESLDPAVRSEIFASLDELNKICRDMNTRILQSDFTGALALVEMIVNAKSYFNKKLNSKEAS